jgi:hypothetical protein
MLAIIDSINKNYFNIFLYFFYSTFSEYNLINLFFFEMESILLAVKGHIVELFQTIGRQF